MNILNDLQQAEKFKMQIAEMLNMQIDEITIRAVDYADFINIDVGKSQYYTVDITKTGKIKKNSLRIHN
ncbi:MAG: hypothetical protein AMQ22_00677 [Candidatus Methanofastidiosum methylothiophilum]|uniref:Uncharacterized protein n=1 Tax=Candidatus Methanofastidiosum methylothiophilum TaxID=1705564 RepID=A0A150J5U8_9EURY|nr:MAG: hypothetical protein AMQ22_00677 [Candidatus Methanofastidiosum methylthiophilus]